MVVDEETALTQDRRWKSPRNRYREEREENLILRLTMPQRGESILEVGCGTGDHLLMFHKQGCMVTGTDSSAFLLEEAKHKLGDYADLRLSRPTDIPFSDNEFDIVSLALSSADSDDLEKSIGEAIRVSRGRVFIGVMNLFSLFALQGNIRELFRHSLSSAPRFFHVGELLRTVKHLLPGVRIVWGSVLFFPDGWYGVGVRLEEAIPVMRNPFGAFLGLSFPVTFTLRTVQDMIADPFKIKQEGQPVQGIIKGRSDDQGSIALGNNLR